jgi:hypothetical protein
VSECQPPTGASEPRELSSAELERRAAEAFVRATTSPAIKASRRVVRWGALLPLCYALALGCASLSPTALTLRASWIRGAQPLVDEVASLVPSVAGIAADLTKRSFGDRVPLVTNIVAFQWLLFGCTFVVAGGIVLPEAARLRRGFIAASEERHRRAFAASRWKYHTAMGVLAVGFCALVFFHGSSHLRGRYGYDLGSDDFALFLQIPALIFGFWLGVYYCWLRLVAMLAPRRPEN